jgi:LysM repeat protein
VGWYNTIGDNETLANISRKYGISVEDLQKANKGIKQSPLQKLPDGTSLKIPRLGIDQMTSRRNLKKQLIANPVGTMYSHPLIHSLSKPGQLPSHIPTQDFTAALLDFLDNVGKQAGKTEGKDTIDIKYIILGIKSLEEKTDNDDMHPLAFRLRSLLHTAQINTQINTKVQATEASIEEFQKSVSSWYDDTVARGSLWYKRRIQRIGILCGFLLAVVLNADAIGLINTLSQNPELRASTVQAAQATAAQGQAPTGGQAQQQLASLGLPIGWSFTAKPPDPHAFPERPEGWVAKIIGLVLTGFAISQGSQIWFDLMNRLLNLRASGAQSGPDGTKEKEKL